MESSLFTVGGVSAFVYASVTLFLYVCLWTRWSIINGGEAHQVLTMINQKRRGVCPLVGHYHYTLRHDTRVPGSPEGTLER